MAKASMKHDPDFGRVPDRVIAARYGCNPSTVWSMRRREKIPSSQQRRRIAIALDTRALTCAEAAAAHGVSPNTVKKAWREREGHDGV